ncbi:MAG: hypothetical protein AVDCRST_MAG49-25, partial [uncultured Thermomicrobiales bacterium]
CCPASSSPRSDVLPLGAGPCPPRERASTRPSRPPPSTDPGLAAPPPG